MNVCKATFCAISALKNVLPRATSVMAANRSSATPVLVT
ncbi:hypothetical protein [Methylotenera sp. 73s]